MFPKFLEFISHKYFPETLGEGDKLGRWLLFLSVTFKSNFFSRFISKLPVGARGERTRLVALLQTTMSSLVWIKLPVFPCPHSGCQNLKACSSFLFSSQQNPACRSLLSLLKGYQLVLQHSNDSHDDDDDDDSDLKS